MPDKKLTDSEIVKALKCCIDVKGANCHECPYDECCSYPKSTMLEDALDLINRLQTKVNSFEKRQKPTGASGYKIENGKVVFFTNMLGGCKIVKENLEEVVKTLNELLHEAYAKDEIAFALKCKTEELKTAKAEAYKEFAEKLKKALYSDSCRLVFDSDLDIFECAIDNLLKELVGEGM